jgi:hypothetical protein
MKDSMKEIIKFYMEENKWQKWLKPF